MRGGGCSGSRSPSLVTMLANKIRGRKPKPPSGPPRTRTVNGVVMKSTGSELHT